jgi:hypothetical protein
MQRDGAVNADHSFFRSRAFASGRFLTGQPNRHIANVQCDILHPIPRRKTPKIVPKSASTNHRLEGSMTTLIREEAHRFTFEGHKENKDYDARIIAGFGLAMIAVVIAVCTVAVGSGVDASNLQLMSVFP